VVPGRSDPLGGATRSCRFAANVAVEIGGVCVTPGDYVYADASGAVVIPEQSLERVIDEALKVEDEDAQSLDRMAAEVPRSALSLRPSSRGQPVILFCASSRAVEEACDCSGLSARRPEDRPFDEDPWLGELASEGRLARPRQRGHRTRQGRG